MKFQSQSDCDVLVVSPSYDSYRVVNETLRSMGLSVMWSTDAEAVLFLVNTAGIQLVIFDARLIDDEMRSMVDQLRPGVRHLMLTLPKCSADPEDLDSNVYAYKRLMHGVTSRMAEPQMTMGVA